VKLRAKRSQLKLDASGANLTDTIHSLPYAGFLPSSVVVQVHAGPVCLGKTLSEFKWKLTGTGLRGSVP